MKAKMLHFISHHYIKVIVFLLVSNLFHQQAQAQTASRDSLLIRSFETDALLPVLIDSAIVYSPELRRIDNNIGLLDENTKLNKKSILNAVTLLTSYGYGTSGDITVGNEGNGRAPSSYFKSTQQDRYNVGVNLTLPITHIVSRRNVIRAGQFQVKMAEAERDNIVLYVKQEVIRMYQELKLAHKLLSNSSQGKQGARLNLQLGEKQFSDGQIDLDQYARMQDIYSKASMEVENNINRFQTNYMQLEVYTGTSIYSLLSKLK